MLKVTGKRPDVDGSGTFFVIYMTGDGLDYCRECLTAETYDAAINEAQRLFQRKADRAATLNVRQFRLEYWW